MKSDLNSESIKSLIVLNREKSSKPFAPSLYSHLYINSLTSMLYPHT